MSKYGNSLKNSGYDQEEAHFHKIEQELIQKVRENTRKASHLTLLQGGKEEAPAKKKTVRTGASKKAA